MIETIASLQAAQERMELRARATAALEAATQRAAASSAQKASERAATAQWASAASTAASSSESEADPGSSAVQAAPKAAAVQSAPKALAPRPKESDELQARIQKALEAAQNRQASEALEAAQNRQASEDLARLPEHLAAPPPVGQAAERGWLPGPHGQPSGAAKGAARRPQAGETLEDRIHRAMA